jgi:hypothetical protein
VRRTDGLAQTNRSRGATAERQELEPARDVVIELKKRTPNPYGLPQPKGSVRVFAKASESGAPAWFASSVFLDHAEHRESALERAALSSPESLEQWTR